MINKSNIKKAIIDLEGSSYITFETDLELKNESLGDFYWQGNKKFFSINMFDLLEGVNDDFEDETLETFLTNEAIEYLKKLADNEFSNLI